MKLTIAFVRNVTQVDEFFFFDRQFVVSLRKFPMNINKKKEFCEKKFFKKTKGLVT